MSGTHELFSWDAINSSWVAVDQGTPGQMAESRDRKYAAASKYGLTGAAWLVAKRGQPPISTPFALGIEVVR